MPSLQDADTAAWVIGAVGLEAADDHSRAEWPPGPGHLAVVILARDEANVLAETIRSIRAELRPDDELHVVADHCRDATAAVARESGARVHVRAGRAAAGKGEALAWWLARTRPNAPGSQRIIVLDADSRVEPGFLAAMRRGWQDEDEAYQARIVPTLQSASLVGRLARFSELTEQDVPDRLSALLGLPVRLRGTGMGLTRSVLEGLAPQLRTAVEDAELSLLLAAHGVPIRPIRDARVLDPKPKGGMAAARQRARWLRGQVRLIREHPRELLHLALLRPRSWPMLASIFLKPKSLWIPLKGALTMAAWTMAARHPLAVIPALLLMLWLGWDLACLVIGLAWIPDKAATLRALVLSPLYLVVWGMSAALALASGEAWLRARPIGEISHPASEAGSGG